jgi:hypothetical protein
LGQGHEELDAGIDGREDTRRRIDFVHWALREPAPPVDRFTVLEADVVAQIQWMAARSVPERISWRETITQSFLQEGFDLADSGDVAHWVGEARSDIRSIVANWNGPLAEYGITLTEYADGGSVRAVQHGSPAAGLLPLTGAGTPKDFRAPPPLSSLRAECRARNTRTLNSMREDSHGHEILRQVRRDAVPGVDRMTDPVPVSEVDLDECLLAKGFSIEQGAKIDGTPKIRVVWNETASGTNEHTQPTEKLSCDGIDKLLALAAAFFMAFGIEPALWKADIDSAFRRVPVGEGFEWLMWVCFMVNGKVWASRHRVFPFGCTSAVHSWNRVGAMLRHIVLHLLHLPVFRYVDDFFGVEHPDCVAHALHCFKRIVRAIMGPEAIADMKCAFGSSLVVLGLDCSFRDAAAVVWPDEEKAAKWLAGIKCALDRGSFGPGEASKLLGRLSWANAYAFGKLGRAMLWPIRQQRYAPPGGYVIPRQLRTALRWWCRVLSEKIGIVWPLRSVPRQHLELFCDAEGSPPRLAGVLFSNNGARIQAYKCDVSKIVLEAYRERSDAQIMTLEIMAILVAIYTFSDDLQGAVVRVWTDNTGGECTLRKGSAKQEDHNLLVFAVWFAAARLGCALWFERVGTKDNISDQPSRGYDDALSLLGAEWVEPVMPGELGRPADWVDVGALGEVYTLTRDGARLAVEATAVSS